MIKPNNILEGHRRAVSDTGAINKKRLSQEPPLYNQEIKKLDHEQNKLQELIKTSLSIQKENFNKKQKIRVQQWLSKLSDRPNNIIWRKNTIFYLKILLQMINEGQLSHPFSLVPKEGALPNLRMSDISFTIRNKMEEFSKNSRQSSKNKPRVSSTKQKALNIINFREEVDYDEFIEGSQNICKKSCYLNRSNYMKSCQVSEKRSQNVNINKIKLNLKRTAEQSKQNCQDSIKQSNITRRLFEKDQNTYPPSSNIRSLHNNTVCSFQGLDHKQSARNFGIELLIKVFRLIQSSKLARQPQAENLCQKIALVSSKMGIFINSNDNPDLELSESSMKLLKVSENIRMKFSETDSETLEFMNFLQQLKISNQ